MKKYILIMLLIFIPFTASASLKKNIILNLQKIENLNFNFEQNINGKTENGNCTIKYPKKIFCKYNLGNQKVLVSDGKWLVIKTTASYYKYPLNRTPLNYLLDKEFLMKTINNLSHRIVENKFVNFSLIEKENKINIFFDIKNHNLVGWQTLDVYQNLSITYLNSININQNLRKNIFKLPERN